jgi:multidrug efflux pump subunit AcrA (membrane-fusion protein)
MVFVAAEKNGQWFALARRVELGDVIGRSVRVLHGIAPGERVITAGSTIVHNGALLTIAP